MAPAFGEYYLNVVTDIDLIAVAEHDAIGSIANTIATCQHGMWVQVRQMCL